KEMHDDRSPSLAGGGRRWVPCGTAELVPGRRRPARCSQESTRCSQESTTTTDLAGRQCRFGRRAEPGNAQETGRVQDYRLAAEHESGGGKSRGREEAALRVHECEQNGSAGCGPIL